MNARVLRLAGMSLALSATLLLGACHKKTAAVVPPSTPPPPEQPVANATPAPAPAQTSQPARQAAAQAAVSDSDLFQRNVKDIYFNYDRYDVRPADSATLQADAKFLAAHPGYKVTISGHCDERGSEDYNMALGSSRADGVRAQLSRLGIAPDRIKTISYGKEKPFCTEENEQCWQQNRRAHFSLDR